MRIRHYSETLIWRRRFPLQLGVVHVFCIFVKCILDIQHPIHRIPKYMRVMFIIYQMKDEQAGSQGVQHGRLRLIRGNLSCRHSFYIFKSPAPWSVLDSYSFCNLPRLLHTLQSPSFQSPWLALSLHAPPHHVHENIFTFIHNTFPMLSSSSECTVHDYSSVEYKMCSCRNEWPTTPFPHLWAK